MPLTFADAAEEILKRHSKGAPMSYREISELALSEGLIEPGGQTPEASMNVAIRQDIKRNNFAERNQRFREHGRGMYSLAAADDSLGGAIQSKNEEVRRKLRERLSELHPQLFEQLIGTLLEGVGYEEVEVTKYVGDGGIDVRATLTVGGVTRVQTAIQVKRWAKNVSGRTVRELRGALGPHERGLIITLSGFTRDAVADASSETRMPISLIDGERLLDLLMEHDIGVTRRKLTVYELDEEAFSTDAEAVQSDPASPNAEVPAGPRRDGRARSLWPLPGGRRAWKESLDRMLQFVASSRPTMAEAVAWMIGDFPTVSSGQAARGFWQVPKSFGLVEVDGEHLTLTIDAADYLRKGAPHLLVDAARRNVLGMEELLLYLAERPHTPAEILNRMRSELGVGWETELQVDYRLGWLENLGMAQTDGDSWSLEIQAEMSGAAVHSTAAPDRVNHTHFSGKPAEILRLFELLADRIKALAPEVRCVPRKQYLGFQVGKKTICSVIPQTKRLRLVLPMDPSIKHPLTRDLRGIGHWGVGDLEVSFESPDQLDQIMRWIAEAAGEALPPSPPSARSART